MCAHYMYAGSLGGRTRGQRHRGRVKRERKSANEEDEVNRVVCRRGKISGERPACVVSVVCRLEEDEATEGRRKMRRLRKRET